ncbi:hypothetical protein [Allocoleopsis sp.]|uniref:hypothetical protein n=1 Tax=Allocoleopsis sp. TaxID=3088169 RepID=UPI002FD3B364
MSSTRGCPLPVDALYLWTPSTCGCPLPVDALYLWISSTCGYPLPVDALYLGRQVQDLPLQALKLRCMVGKQFDLSLIRQQHHTN